MRKVATSSGVAGICIDALCGAHLWVHLLCQFHPGVAKLGEGHVVDAAVGAALDKRYWGMDGRRIGKVQLAECALCHGAIPNNRNAPGE